MNPKLITALLAWTESNDPLAMSAITIASLCIDRGCEPDQLSRLMCFCFAAGRLSLTRSPPGLKSLAKLVGTH